MLVGRGGVKGHKNREQKFGEETGVPNRKEGDGVKLRALASDELPEESLFMHQALNKNMLEASWILGDGRP